MFRALGDPMFRRAEADGVPVMVVVLGDRQAALPLRAVQREFGIADDSPDGRMLTLIAQALDFVTALRPGDTLPNEVLTGEASWSPDPSHVAIVAARLRLQLVDWLTSGAESERARLDPETLLQIEDDPHLRAQVQTALARAAEELHLANAEAVLEKLEALARELGYIEALRERLLVRVRRMAERVERLARGWRGDAHHNETLTQVRRLAATAVAQTQARFDELDAQTGEVMAALRNAESQRAFIRTNRDWLYRSLRAWEPLLNQWDEAPAAIDQDTIRLIQRTYQFLAPRYMPVQEWLSVAALPAARPKQLGMVW
ncbi:MAG TPA: hypothetical protein VFA03_14630 [Acetobacteraceae bacterium]|nr:hypothetical protein [Acetobacteraceae bacterium]